MESDLLLHRWDFCPRLATDHEAQCAVLKLHITCPGVSLPCAVVAGRFKHDCPARWALAQRRCLAGLALLMRWGCSTAIDVERPFDMVLGQAVTEYGAGMVEDDCAVLALGRPQHAANHLPE